MFLQMVDFFKDLGKFIAFGLEAFSYIPANLRNPKELIINIWSIGTKSVTIMIATGLFSGMIMGLEMGKALETLLAGTSFYVGGALSVSIIKELGPVLSSLIIVSRVCSSVTAQLGTMKVTEQIDALRTLSVNPISYLVTPRILAGMISLPILGYISIFASMIGGWFSVIMIHKVDSGTYWEWAQVPLSVDYIFQSYFKMVIIGAILLMISTYQGFHAKGGAAGVGEATIKSVVISSFMVILTDYLLGAIFIIFSK